MVSGLQKEHLVLRLARLRPTDYGKTVDGVLIEAGNFQREDPHKNLEANVEGLWLGLSLLEKRLQESGVLAD